MFLLVLLLEVIFSSLGTASPVLNRRDIPSSLLEQFNRFSQYAAAANCKANHNESSPGLPVYCDPGNCPLVKEADTEIVEGFWGVEPGDTTGYLALDRTNKLVLLVFRGTVSNENGETDMKFKHVDASDMCAGCKAHEGFWGAINSALEKLASKIEDTLKANPGFSFVVAGHSLGGALATLGGTTLRNKGHTLDMYTFGAPSVGNYALAKYITDQNSGKNYRITHTDDEVPKVLYRASREWLLHLIVPEYSQSSPEYWITSENDVDPTESDIKLIEEINNEEGNLGQGGISLDAHGQFLHKL
ncbi:hypothetical protein EYZ11_010011 [Aspergillus tanneri]|uniref:feruloyl esterase n=1 Tax=Aspergillus tanneri TaxID=1220188 RepID=A0A4S3J8K1_9EURO|nr:hypothetical protein EYZ11_010011 [Aspergillus tanneri]